MKKTKPHPAIRSNTRYAFISIALMLLVFMILVALMTVPLGIPLPTLTTIVRVLLYVLGGLIAVGAFFSLRVSWLRKK